MNRTSNNRLRIVAALAVLHGDRANDLSEYLAAEDRIVFQPIIEAYATDKNAPSKMDQIIRQMVASEHFSSIAEIHPAWILEHLRDEPPRIVGLVLRSLPSKHVRYILEHMPPMLKAKLPNMVESFLVPGPILNTIRRRFENHFLPMRASRTVDRLGFEQLYYLKGEELEELIRDIGLTELAIALSGLAGKTLHAVFNRLNIKDAKRLQKRMRDMPKISPEFFRQARYTILETEGKRIGPERMLMRVGLGALAVAVGPEHDYLVRLLMQRLAPPDGYLFKRLIDERSMRPQPLVAVERQNLILETIVWLANEGRIGAEWGRLFSFERVDEQDPILLSKAQEETETVFK